MEEDIFNTELGKKILALTKASFKVSDLIPDLVMREKIKSQILNVYELFFSAPEGRDLASGGEKKYSELLKEIDVLDNFFFLAGQLNFVKDIHLRVLRNGFLVFKSRIVLVLNEPPKVFVDSVAVVKKEAVEPEVKLSERPAYTGRQEKILEKFQSKETLKLAEILDLFPGVSEKTVRNELSSLIGFKKIIRSGQGGGSFYKIVR